METPNNDKKVSRTNSAFIALPNNKIKKWDRLAVNSGMTRAKYARSSVMYALENELVFKEVKTLKVVVEGKKPTE